MSGRTYLRLSCQAEQGRQRSWGTGHTGGRQLAGWVEGRLGRLRRTQVPGSRSQPAAAQRTGWKPAAVRDLPAAQRPTLQSLAARGRRSNYNIV